MLITVRYGGYSHQPGEVEYEIQRALILSDAQTPLAETWTVPLKGLLLGNGVADMNAKVTALDRAYSRNGLDFWIGEGAQSLVSFRSRSTIGGVRVVQHPNLPTNRGAVYATNVPYALAVEAVLPIANPATALRSFKESVQFSGGGPSVLWMTPLVGRPQRQIGSRSTTYKAVQQGSAVGYLFRPQPPPPIWPQFLSGNPAIGKLSGKPFGAQGDVIDRGITWRYEFESATPLFGEPRNWM